MGWLGIGWIEIGSVAGCLGYEEGDAGNQSFRIWCVAEILFSEVSSSGVRNTVLVMDRDFSWGLFGSSDQSLGFVGALATMERVSTDIAELCFNR